MSAPFSEDKPRLYRFGRRCSPTAEIADPSLTLVEVSESTGLLLAESCHEDALGRFHLETVMWLRFMGPFFELAPMRSFEDVLLHRHPSGLFVAQDIRSDKLFPHPSTTAYYVSFLTAQEYEAMQQQVDDPFAEGFSALVQQKIETLPGFQIDGWEISAPTDYATAEADGLEAKMLF